MTAPLATLAFLAILWLVNLVAADTLARSIGKIAAALKGQSPLATAPAIRPVAVRVSQRSPAMRGARVQPQLRAAA
jgi:hypothetical protein